MRSRRRRALLPPPTARSVLFLKKATDDVVRETERRRMLRAYLPGHVCAYLFYHMPALITRRDLAHIVRA